LELTLQRNYITGDGTLSRNKRKHSSGELLVELEKPVHGIHSSLVLHMHVVSCLFTPLQAIAQIEEGVLDVKKSGIGAFWRRRHKLGWSAWLRCNRLCVIAFTMHEGVSASPSLDLAQTYKVTALEVAIAVLELPERRIRISCVKYIAFFVKAVHIQLSYK
jgi:hypothetical protein